MERLMRVLFAALATLFITSATTAAEIKVSVVLSLKEAITEIARDYKSAGGDDVSFTFGASGQLATQIRNGSDADAFISAANKQVDDLAKDGLVVEASRRTVVGNTLVLVVPATAQDVPTAFAD